MSANESYWQAWVRKAEQDLLDIQNNLAAQEVPWSPVCFHAQQAAEKMLKALLVFHGTQPRKTHDLLDLLEECLAREPRVDGLRQDCVLLNPYSVEVRYPQPFPEPDAEDGRKAVEATERVVSLIRLCLPRPPARPSPSDGEQRNRSGGIPETVRRLPWHTGVSLPGSDGMKEHRTVGRITVFVTVENASDPQKRIECNALVDTGASHLILPNAWRPRLGELKLAEEIQLEMADQTPAEGVVCGPVLLQIEGFRPISSEVVFVDMKPEDGRFEPLIGYIPLEQSQAAVDMLGHRLVRVKRMDLK